MVANLKYKVCIFPLILKKGFYNLYNTIYSYVFQSLL